MRLCDRRDFYRKDLHSVYLPIYDALCKDLGPEWQPYYGLRTFAEQDKLYALGRTLPGSIVTNAQGGESAHNYGCATDWTMWNEDGTPIWMKFENPIVQKFGEIATRVGAQWGGAFHSPDGPHVELHLMVSWKSVKAVALGHGMYAAMEYVRMHKG